MKSQAGKSIRSRLVLLAMSFTAAASLVRAQDLQSRVDQQLDRALSERRIVGTVVLVARNGQTVYHRAAGNADREAERPMWDSTIFRLGSLSKPIVTAAALKLYDDGRLDLNDPVTKWLPSFKPKLPDGSLPVVTVRELLTHTAGLSYGFLQTAGGSLHTSGASDGLDDSGLTLDDEVQRIASVGLAFPPGSQWNYSLAIDVLGAVIARVTGESLPEAVQHLVCQPLGMKDTGFSMPNSARLAAVYVDARPEPARMTDPQELGFGPGRSILFSPSRISKSENFASGGAGMYSTASDYLVFLEAVRSGGRGWLKSSTAKSMMENQVGNLATHAPGWGFGFGGAVLKDPVAAKTPQSMGTWAWTGVYGSTFFVDPVRGISVVILTNTTLEGMRGAYVTSIRDAVYSEQ